MPVFISFFVSYDKTDINVILWNTKCILYLVWTHSEAGPSWPWSWGSWI